MNRPLTRGILALALASTGLAQESQAPAISTSRPAARALPLPKDSDAFSFVIYGDRTGGPKAGIKVLAQAVEETNLLDPDLVMTVGDLIQGYNARDAWMDEMREFRGTMAKLKMPWFPVAGNHDIYWRGPGKPPEEHEQDYETHFGPLWYAFDHKECRFVILYSDEPNPKTGERNFGKAECQRMSPAQFDWLKATLASAKKHKRVFVFLHHPRWTGGKYGRDWQKVHKVLVDAGNVSAVFGGHIHHMRYDPRDGIEYFALATTGGHLNREFPRAGWLHHYNVVTVRDEGLQVATVPVGSAFDPRAVTGEVSGEVEQLVRSLAFEQDAPLKIGADGGIDQTVTMRWQNPLDRPVELLLTPGCRDAQVRMTPTDARLTVQPRGQLVARIAIQRRPNAFDDNFALPTLQVGGHYTNGALRLALPEASLAIECTPPDLTGLARSGQRPNRALAIASTRDVVRIESKTLQIPDGPFTIEGWLHPTALKGRRGFLAKTEGSEYGIFVSDGRPVFSVHLNGRYVNADAKRSLLQTDRWHHLAGVFDGRELRLYVDGQRVAKAAGSGKRTRNDLPLYVGADVNGRGGPTSTVLGQIDEVRITTDAQYHGARFETSRRLPTTANSILHLRFDDHVGPWLIDAAGRTTPRMLGGAELRVPSPQPNKAGDSTGERR